VYRLPVIPNARDCIFLLWDLFTCSLGTRRFARPLSAYLHTNLLNYLGYKVTKQQVGSFKKVPISPPKFAINKNIGVCKNKRNKENNYNK
jgi:hypothetical protein